MKKMIRLGSIALLSLFVAGNVSAQTAPPPPPPAPMPVTAAAPAAPKPAAKPVVKKKKPQPDIKVLKHDYFTSYFSSSKRIPELVTYTLTKEMIWCRDPFDRTNKFAPDPLSPALTSLSGDYLRSGYDRGHNMSAADNQCDEDGMTECFYFSNMTPQPHFFNAGVWEELEKAERNEAMKHGEIRVAVGSVGKATTIGAHKVVVPKYMWKVIYIPEDDAYFAYYFPNSDEATGHYEDYRTTLKYIRDNTGVKFNDGSATMTIK